MPFYLVVVVVGLVLHISSVVRRTGECLILHENTIPRYKRLKIPYFFNRTNNYHKSIQLFKFLIVMKVEFSLLYNAKFNCVNIFGTLSKQCKNVCRLAMPRVLSTLHMLCTLPTDKQNVHKSNAYTANKNICQFAKPVPSHFPCMHVCLYAAN